MVVSHREGMHREVHDSQIEKRSSPKRARALKLIEVESSCDRVRVRVIDSSLATLDTDVAATPGVLVALVLAGFVGAPLPEEGVFAYAGWSAKSGSLAPGVAFGVPYVTVLALDAFVFAVGRRLGPALRRSRLVRRIPRRRLARVRLCVSRRGMLAVAAARMVMGTRVPTFLAAGAGGLSWRRFLATDVVFLVLSGGWPFLLGGAIEDAPRLFAQIGSYARWLGPGIAVVLVVLLIRARRRGPRRS